MVGQGYLDMAGKIADHGSTISPQDSVTWLYNVYEFIIVESPRPKINPALHRDGTRRIIMQYTGKAGEVQTVQEI